MNLFQELSNHIVTLSIGSGILHFLWQGTLIALLLAGLLRILNKASAETRYLVCWMALLAMIVIPVMTVSNSISSNTQPYYSKAFEEETSGAQNLEAIAPEPAALSSSIDQVPTEQNESYSIAGFLMASRPYVAMLWVLGVVFFTARLYKGLHTANQVKRLQALPVDASMMHMLRHWSQAMGITKSVSLKISHYINQPVLIGWLKPVVLLPASLVMGMPPEQFKAALIHELAHIKRHDYLLATVQSVIETLLFFHPAVWWISNQIRIEREFCCDDLAVRVLGERQSYLRTLMNLESNRLKSPVLALSMRDGSLLERVKRIVNKPAEAQTPLRIRHSSFIITLLICVIISVGITACNQFSLSDEAETPLTASVDLPIELEQKLTNNDIEGVIAHIHELIADEHEDALSLTYAAYEKAFDEDLRQNLIYTFAHFNTEEADKLLIHIAKTDEKRSVRQNAMRAFSLRLEEGKWITRSVPNNMYTDPSLFEYPEISEDQLIARYSDFMEIGLDENQHEYTRRTAIRLLGHLDSGQSYLETIYNAAQSNRAKVHALRYWKINSDEKAALLASLIDPNEDRLYHVHLGFNLSETGSILAVKPLLEIINLDLQLNTDAFSSTSSLSGLLSRLSTSDYPIVQQAVDQAREQTQDVEKFDEALSHVQRILNGEIPAPTFEVHRSR